MDRLCWWRCSSRAGVGAAKGYPEPLLGQPPAPELVDNIEHTILSHPQIVGVHDPGDP